MTKSSLLRCLSLAVVSTALYAPLASAQDERDDEEAPKRHWAGISGTLARPVGEFQNFVSWGGGGSLYGVYNFKRGPLGIRFDGSLLSYGHEKLRVPLSLTIQRIWVDVSTDNIITTAGVGPQLTLGAGPVRPYVYGTVGFSYFATVSSVEGASDDAAFASTTNYDDVTVGLSAGGGFMIQVSRGKNPVSLDLSVQSFYNGRMSYLRSGSLLEAADGSISFIPIRSEANLVTFRVGFAVGV
jgi:hypothetical protein